MKCPNCGYDPDLIAQQMPTGVGIPMTHEHCFCGRITINGILHRKCCICGQVHALSTGVIWETSYGCTPKQD